MTPATRPSSILDQKAAAKAELQKALGWKAEPRRALLCIPTGMTDVLGGTLLEDVMPGLLTLPIQIAIVGKGSSVYGTYFTTLAKDKPHKVGIITNDDASLASLYLASDMALFCAPAADMPELASCLEHGVVPLAPAADGLINYDPNQEAGNSFTYDQLSHWHVFGAAVRAVETYRFPYDWKTIQKNAVAMSDEEREAEEE